MTDERWMHLDFHLPTRIVYGPGRLAELGEIAAALGRRALVVSTPGVPHLHRATRLLEDAGVEAVVFDEAEPNPSGESVDAAGRIAREEHCELTIGLGGGSAMDTAKGAAVMATNQGPAWEYTIEFQGDRRELERQPLPIVAVPTTAGTGSEVNFIAVLSNPRTGQKGPLRSDSMRPAYALIDPELTLTLPPAVTASTGFDALTHAFERFFGGHWHPFVDTMAEGVMSAVVSFLPRVLDSPDDLEGRCQMSWAATQAAMCVLAPMGEAGLHIFGLAVSAMTDAVHGQALAAMMGPVLSDLATAYPERAARLAGLLGAEPRAEAVVPAMKCWMRSVEMDLSLGDVGVDDGSLERLVAATNMERLAASYHREMSAEQVLAIYESAMEPW